MTEAELPDKLYFKIGEVAKLVAVAIENAMAFREIARLKDKLAEERLYLESEIRTELTFEQLAVGVQRV